MDQQVQEIVITFPGTYHGRFSIGKGDAEASKYAEEHWTPKGYFVCTTETCGDDAITAEKMQLEPPKTRRQLGGKGVIHDCMRQMDSHLCTDRPIIASFFTIPSAITSSSIRASTKSNTGKR